MVGLRAGRDRGGARPHSRAGERERRDRDDTVRGCGGEVSGGGGSSDTDEHGVAATGENLADAAEGHVGVIGSSEAAEERKIGRAAAGEASNSWRGHVDGSEAAEKRKSGSERLCVGRRSSMGMAARGW